jgi:hypothetical protein
MSSPLFFTRISRGEWGTDEDLEATLKLLIKDAVETTDNR